MSFFFCTFAADLLCAYVCTHENTNYIEVMKGEYTTKARVFPTVLTMIPFIVLYIWVLAPMINPILAPVWDYLPVVAGVSIHAVLLYAFMQLNRFLSKAIFQDWLFLGDLHMPTTDMLMPNHASLDAQTRKRYYEQINRDFNIDVKKDLSKLKTENDQRMMLTRLVGQIRPKLKDNAMVQQHNREFGFIRNLVGGSLSAFVISIALVIVAAVAKNNELLYTSIILAVIYLFPIIFSKVLITRFGRNYAYVLFEQYASNVCISGDDMKSKNVEG